MKKVAIMTFSYSQNMGTLLQAYALKEYIEKQGFICDLVRYRKFDRKPFETIKGIPDAIDTALHIFSGIRKISKIDKFRQDYLSFTPKVCETAEDMQVLNQDYDIFVAGSDQIWNVHKGIVKPYFLTFVNKEKTKIAYSASFGLSTLPEQYKEEVKTYLKEFDAISIREQTGMEIANALVVRDYTKTIDPVFLKPRGEWESLCGERKLQGDYIFVYPTQITDLLQETVIKAKQELGCKVYSLFYFKGVDKSLKDSDPIDFINYIRYAKLVIASSFHATAFSLIFRKNLRVIPHKETGSRVVDLLTEIHLSKCLVEADRQCDFCEISYEEANSVLEEMKNNSEQFLKNALMKSKE